MRRKIRTLSVLTVGILLAGCDISLFQTAIAVLSNVNGAALPAGPAGSTVIVQGAGFGDTQGSGRVLFTPLGGGIPLVATVASAADWRDVAVVAAVPDGAPGDYVVNLQSGNGSGSGGVLFTITAPPAFDPSVVTWTAGPALPGAISGAGVAFAQVGNTGYLYVVGGAAAGGAPVATVSYAVVGTNGAVGAWTATTSLPAALEFPAAVAATRRNSAVITNGYLYAIGGATSAAGAPVSTVYRAPLNNDGSLGSWSSITALPAPVRSVAAIVMYGSMYVFGGATNSNAPVATSYRAPIQVTGNLNSWMPQPALPSARARFGFGAYGLYLYAFGGDSTALAPTDTAGGAKRTAQVAFAKLNPSTRDITAWTTATTALTDARSAFPAAVGAGKVLLTGGLYSGASGHTSEASFTALNADGTVGTFATGGSSIYSACGCNLFNNGGTGYLAGNGTFHVLIVGGDDLNAPGTPRAETYTF